MNAKVTAVTEVTWQCRQTSLEKGSQTYGGLLGAKTSWEGDKCKRQSPNEELSLPSAELSPNCRLDSREWELREQHAIHFFLHQGRYTTVFVPIMLCLHVGTWMEFHRDHVLFHSAWLSAVSVTQ